MWSYSGCCSCGHNVPAWYYPHPQAPYHPHHPHHSHRLEVVPKELSADSTASSVQVTIGGVESAFLTLDYLKDAGTGTASPSVKVSISDPTGTGEWSSANIPDGFQAKVDFLSAAPGATVMLTVTGCTAQLRWVERVH